MRVLIVDDTIAYRSMLRLALSEVQGIEVVGTASNGKLALQKLEQSSVDLVVMDIEMPEMDGLQAVKAMRDRGIKSKVIMFSAATMGSAEMTMRALQSGADDVVAKPGSNVGSTDEAIAQIRGDLIPKIKQFDRTYPGSAHTSPKVDLRAPKLIPSPVKKVSLSSMKPEIILIASSTGGPAALEELFTGIGSSECPPILIAQHMPPVFTRMLAERIARVSSFQGFEAKDNELLRSGNVYVAPGDFHLELFRDELGRLRSRTHQGPKVNSVRPAADLLFKSAAEVCISPCVSIVLTGMGDDGCAGAEAIKHTNGFVFIQDEKSSVVWGMPGAVYRTGRYDQIGTLSECQNVIKKFCK